MIIHRPKTASEAVALRYANPDTTAYLAGGTDDLRLGGAAEGKELIDINALGFDTIEEKNGISSGKPYFGRKQAILRHSKQRKRTTPTTQGPLTHGMALFSPHNQNNR